MAGLGPVLRPGGALREGTWQPVVLLSCFPLSWQPVPATSLCLGMTVRGWGGQGEDGVSSFNLGESVLEEKKKKKDVLGVLEVDLMQAE